ncbi:hypothetical protein CNR22_03285 [Sphingobacteriaceae bacterium]|nr:hypothetical protein CNR22_03285 [Sphingobacteriaceae bacterium]
MTGKVHKSTSLAALFCLFAVLSLILEFFLISALLCVCAFFMALKELSSHTSKFQFITIFIACCLLGLAIDFPNQNFPLTVISMALLAAVTVARIAFFPVFSYTLYSWFEPVFLLTSFLLFLSSNLLYHHDWQAYLLPLPLYVFGAVFCLGTLKDKNQLLKNSLLGYRIQIGKLANDFELPDQNGTITKLSDYKNERHVLLIFVRGDWCPGCHMMLRTYEKNNDKFKSKNVLVIAIGPDPVGVNRAMVEKLGVDFKVLSDEGQRTAMIYGVQLKEYDNKFADSYKEGIPLPASFLIDKSGVVRYVSRPDKVGEFLNPSLIFPMVDQLDSLYEESKKNMPLEKEGFAALKTSLPGQKSDAQEIKIAALQKELNNYQSIIDQANDAMIVIDIVDGKIHQTNPSAAKLLGYETSELLQLSLFDLHPQEFLNKSSQIVADVWEKGGLIYTDIPFVTKAREIIPVECSAKVAPFSGRPAIVIYARDIRERLKLQQEITNQRKLIDEKSKDISDSIEYSKRIQRSVFVDKEKLKILAPESFILFKPRDVVSGDFYWFSNYTIKYDYQNEAGDNYIAGTEILVVAAVDCTGHGVPGAFMSIIANTLLNQTLTQVSIPTPANALDYVNTELKKKFNKNEGDTPIRDGMDIALCCIDRKGMLMEYAGANNPVYIIRGEEIIILKANKQPITASPEAALAPFTNQRIEIKKGDKIYLFTDGFADQFGGEHQKKFMYKNFKEILLSMKSTSMEEQGRILEKTFEDWKGSSAQIDDVLVIGIEI